MQYFSISPTIGQTDLHSTPAPHFKTFRYSHLLFEVSRSQHNIKLCSKFSNSLIYSLDFSKISWWKVFFLLIAVVAMAIPDYFHMYILHRLLPCYSNSWKMHIIWILLIYYNLRGPDSSVDIATDYGLDGPGSNPSGDEIFRPSRPALWPTQHPVKLVTDLSRG